RGAQVKAARRGVGGVIGRVAAHGLPSVQGAQLIRGRERRQARKRRKAAMTESACDFFTPEIRFLRGPWSAPARPSCKRGETPVVFDGAGNGAAAYALPEALLRSIAA